MSRPAVFIDRDGTINEQRGYINHLSRFVLLPGAAKAFKLLNQSQFLAIIVTNQSGIARGYFPKALVDDVHRYMRELLKKEDAYIDGIFVCPHYPTGRSNEYNRACECRKPGTGLIAQAREQFHIDMSKSYVIGDRSTDIEMAHRADIDGVLVKSGYGIGEIDFVLPKIDHKPIYIAEDLLHAVQWIIEKESG